MFLMKHDLIGLRLTLGPKIGCWYYFRQYHLADQFNKTCFQWGFWGRGESVEWPKVRHYKILIWPQSARNPIFMDLSFKNYTAEGCPWTPL